LALDLKCADAGAISHSPAEDQNGWDRLIEFPSPPSPGPADTHAPAKSAFVQVKSTMQANLSVRISLSNALKAAQSPEPWFLMLVVGGPNSPKPKIYAVHLWEDFLRRALKAVRQAENSKAKLNKRTIGIGFTENDRHDDDLIAWMTSEIGGQGADYQQRKQEFYRKLGYEDGAAVGRFTVAHVGLDEIANNFLGLGDGLPISEFFLAPARFGLVSPRPLVDHTGDGKIVITPSPVDDCEVRFVVEETLYSLKGRVFALGAPIFQDAERRIRFSAEFIEVVIAGIPPQLVTLRISLDPNQQTSLYVLEAFAALKTQSLKGIPIDIQIWGRGRRLANLVQTSDVNSVTSKVEWARFLAAIRGVRPILGVAEETTKRSLNELLKGGQRLAAFPYFTQAPSIRFEFEPTIDAPDLIDSLIFYSYVELDEVLIYCLCECAVTHETKANTLRQLDFGPVRRVDFYSLSNAGALGRQQIEADYRKYLGKREAEGHPLGIGDILEFFQGAKAVSEQSAADTSADKPSDAGKST